MYVCVGVDKGGAGAAWLDVDLGPRGVVFRVQPRSLIVLIGGLMLEPDGTSVATDKELEGGADLVVLFLPSFPSDTRHCPQ